MSPEKNDSILNIWTIYERPRDYPNQCVARRWEISCDSVKIAEVPTNDMFVADTVDELRALLPPGLKCLTRTQADDPVIVETWL